MHLQYSLQMLQKLKNGKIKIVPYSEGRVGYMAFNLASKTVQNKDVRKAILYALKKK